MLPSCAFLITIDRRIQESCLEIIIKKEKKVCELIDISVPSHKNISVNVFEKLRKYKDPEMEKNVAFKNENWSCCRWSVGSDNEKKSTANQQNP